MRLLRQVIYIRDRCAVDDLMVLVLFEDGRFYQ